MSEAEDIYAALRALSEHLIEQRRKAKEQTRLATNARRRKRHAAQVAAGTLPARPAPSVPQYDPEPDSPRSCYCHAAVYPPCGWCENGGNHEEDETQ